MLKLIQSASAKVDFSWTFRCFAKEAVFSLFLWSTLVTQHFQLCINFKMYRALILVFLICYSSSKGHPPKSPFLEVLGALWRKQCIHLSWNTMYIAGCFVLFWFVNIYQECMDKRHFLLRIIFAEFSSALVTQILCVIFLHSENVFCSVKKETMLLLAWPTLYIVLSRYSVS